MKSLVELTKWLIKFAISLCWAALFVASSIFAYAYVKEATSSKLIALAVGSLVLPGSLVQSIFHWSLFDSRPANGWSILRLIGVGALAGILTNSDMRATVKNWFR